MGEGFFAEDAVRGGCGVRRGKFGVEGDDDGLGHAVVEGRDVVAVEAFAAAAFARVVEDADDGGIAAGEDAQDAAEFAAVGSRGGASSTRTWSPCMASPISLGGMKMSSSRSALRGADKAEAVAVEIEASGDEVFGAVAGGAVGS